MWETWQPTEHFVRYRTVLAANYRDDRLPVLLGVFIDELI